MFRFRVSPSVVEKSAAIATALWETEDTYLEARFHGALRKPCTAVRIRTDAPDNRDSENIINQRCQPISNVLTYGQNYSVILSLSSLKTS